MALLHIDSLSVRFPGRSGSLQAVDGLSLTLQAGEVLGIVGESGSGKSVSMMALMGLLAWPAQVRAERLQFNGQDMLGLPPAERRRLVGKDLAMIFQDPATSLNPSFSIGFQLTETLRQHLHLDGRAAQQRAIGLLERVGIPEPARRMKAFPHQLSGGMNQRVMIAMAIACQPRLLIADEPTTALDVTIQAQILDLLRDLQQDHGMAMILITHSMGVVSELAQRVGVMYAGQLMELQATHALLRQPGHPYTAALLAASPERGDDQGRLCAIPGVVPGLYDRPTGCLFAPRCEHASARCGAEQPAWDSATGLRCHHPLRRAAD